jgi:hypothetical protein
VSASAEAVGRGSADLPFADFDRYCDEHGIRPGEEPAAFAAWLHELSGGKWDGPMKQANGQPSGPADKEGLY